MSLDYVFIDDEGNLLGGTYVRPNDPAGNRPIWVSLGSQSRSERIVSTSGGRTDRYLHPVFVSGLPARLPGGGHTMERIRLKAKRSKKAATYSRRLRARGSSLSSARSSKCPDGSYWSWSKKRCVKSKF